MAITVMSVDTVAKVTPRLLRRTTAAEYLGVSIATLDSYRAMGLLMPVPMPSVSGDGRMIRVPLYDRADLDAFIDRIKAGVRS